MLALHIGTGIIVLLFGLLAMISAKGKSLHRLGGNVFFTAMLIVASSAIYLDIANNEVPVIGVLVIYLIATSWMTIRRKEKTVGLFDKVAFVSIIVVAVGLYFIGWQTMNSESGTKNGVPAAVFFVFGSIALFAALLDLIMLIRGGVAGKHRIARHLWRMCVPAIFAIMSLLSQKSVIPESLQGSSMLWLPVLFLLGFMVFWLVRVLFTKWANSNKELIKSMDHISS